MFNIFFDNWYNWSWHQISKISTFFSGRNKFFNNLQISTTYFNQLWSNSHSQILSCYICVLMYWVLKLSIFSLQEINSSGWYDLFNSHNQILSCSLYQQMRRLICFILCFNTTWGYMTMSQFSISFVFWSHFFFKCFSFKNSPSKIMVSFRIILFTFLVKPQHN